MHELVQVIRRDLINCTWSPCLLSIRFAELFVCVLQFNLYLVLLPLNGQSMPKLEKPYLSCQPTFSVRHLCQFVALQLSRHAKEVEIFIRKNPNNGCFASIDTSADEIKLNHDALERLEEEKSLSELYPSLASGHGDLELLYSLKAEV
jgi:E3 ubiquitin-protein ligase RNF1/2